MEHGPHGMAHGPHGMAHGLHGMGHGPYGMEWDMDHMDGKDIEWDTKESIVFLINSVDFEHFNKLKTELDALLSIEERY